MTDETSTALRAKDEDAHVVATSFVVEVVEGADRGARITLDAARPSGALVGQSEACDLRLGDRQVSRRHLALEVSEHGLRVTDLASTNGTFVDGLRVESVFVRGGETIRVGESVLRVAAEGAPAAIALHTAMRFGRMIGASPTMRRLYPLCERLAKSDVPIIIEGETGTGKEVLAEALHEASARATAPFVVFDCTTTAPSLVESTLFGHERGAFTGAVAQRLGVFEQADGGTLFIDELGELDLALQPKLLRAIERREVQRVGAASWRRVDVRVIAATRRDLEREVAAGRFRDDLFFRLAVGRIELPPLRRRSGDVALLARHFWRSLGGDERSVPPGLIARLEDYAWPGNVRELCNTVARHLALGDLATDASAPTTPLEDAEEPNQDEGADVVPRVLAMDLPLPSARQRVVDEFERLYVARVVARYGGNVARAAAASGIARRYFQLLRARQRRA